MGGYRNVDDIISPDSKAILFIQTKSQEQNHKSKGKYTKTFVSTQSTYLNNLLIANQSFLIKFQNNYRKSIKRTTFSLGNMSRATDNSQNSGLTLGGVGIIRHISAESESMFYGQASVSRYNKFLSDSARTLMCSKVSDDGLYVKWSFRRWVEEIINSLPDARRIGMTLEESLDVTFIRQKPLKVKVSMDGSKGIII